MKKWRRNESSSKKRKTTHKSYYLKLKKRRTTTIITCRMEWRVDEVKNRPQEIGTKEDENFICNLFILISRVSRPFIRRTKDSPRSGQRTHFGSFNVDVTISFLSLSLLPLAIRFNHNNYRFDNFHICFTHLPEFHSISIQSLFVARWSRWGEISRQLQNLFFLVQFSAQFRERLKERDEKKTS